MEHPEAVQRPQGTPHVDRPGALAGASSSFRDWDLDGVRLRQQEDVVLAPDLARRATNPYLRAPTEAGLRGRSWPARRPGR